MAQLIEVISDIVSGERLDASRLSGFSDSECRFLTECDRFGRCCGFGSFFDGGLPASCHENMETVASNLYDIYMLESGQAQLCIDYFSVKNAILESMEEFHQLARERNIRLVTMMDSQQLKVYADSAKIRQVLSVLLDNALRFTKDEGVIEILAKGLPQEVLLSVVDHGVGIAPERQKTVFDRFAGFSSMPRELHGTSIQLNLAKLIIATHGGKVWVESTLTYGSSFSFCVPREMPSHFRKPKKASSLFS